MEMHALAGPINATLKCRPGIRVRTALPAKDKVFVDVHRSTQLRASRSSAEAAVVRLDDVATRSFLDWAKSQGIVSASLSPSTFSGLRGLAAVAAVKPDDVLISVPRKAALTISPKQRCPFPDYVTRDYWDKAPWFVKLALQLLHARQQSPQQGGGGSHASQQGDGGLAGYVAQLPQRVDLPVLWSDQALQALQYPHLIQQVWGGRGHGAGGRPSERALLMELTDPSILSAVHQYSHG